MILRILEDLKDLGIFQKASVASAYDSVEYR
jgi:hypothetical protein